jgi:DNA gyrase subunit A
MDRTGAIVAMRCINSSDEIMLMTRDGVVLRTYLNQIRETGRSTQGVKLMDLYQGDQVVGIAIMSDQPNMVMTNDSSENGET